MSSLDYLKLLVNCMTRENDTTDRSVLDNTRYIFKILDDVGGQYGG